MNAATSTDKLPKVIIHNYIIVKKGRRAYIAVNTDAVETVVCRMYDHDGTGVHSGYYCNDYAEALKKFNQRERPG